MIRKMIFSGVTALAGLSAFAGSPYTVQVELPEGVTVESAQMLNFDNGASIDSLAVTSNSVVFKGEIDEPVIARLLLDGSRYAMFYLEPGTVTVDANRAATGTPLNDRQAQIDAEAAALVEQFRAATDEAVQQEIYGRYQALAQATVDANLDNLIGLSTFCDLAPEMDLDEIKAYQAKSPLLAGSKRVAGIVERAERKAATAVGQKYLDFDINGKKLSDYVGRDGHYLLVDFWASWCGPCIRQTRVIKELYSQYKDAGLDVLGVAVWDKPEDTLRAIKQHDLPWECIIDAQTIPTDLYGISGIPCIILIAPDGTILSRDKQNDELKADVARYLDR